MLPPAVLKAGEDYDDLDHMYQRSGTRPVSKSATWPTSSAVMRASRRSDWRRGCGSTPISKARQQAAVLFSERQRLQRRQPGCSRPTSLRKVEPTSGQARVLGLQQAALNSILSPARLTRLQSTRPSSRPGLYHRPDSRRRPGRHLLRACERRGLQNRSYRRNLQRAFVELLWQPADGGSGAAGRRPRRLPALRDDSRGAIRAELKPCAPSSIRKRAAEATRRRGTTSPISPTRSR